MSDVVRLSKRQKRLIVEFQNMCYREAQNNKSDLNEYFRNLNVNEVLLLALSFAVERKRYTMQHFLR